VWRLSDVTASPIAQVVEGVEKTLPWLGTALSGALASIRDGNALQVPPP
jgi:hypothetical protein